MTNTENTQTDIKSLKAQLVPLAPQVAQIKAVFALVASKEQMTEDLWGAARVMQREGYLRWSKKAGRLMFMDKGTKFYRQMKKFG